MLLVPSLEVGEKDVLKEQLNSRNRWTCAMI